MVLVLVLVVIVGDVGVATNFFPLRKSGVTTNGLGVIRLLSMFRKQLCTVLRVTREPLLALAAERPTPRCVRPRRARIQDLETTMRLDLNLR